MKQYMYQKLVEAWRKEPSLLKILYAILFVGGIGWPTAVALNLPEIFPWGMQVLAFSSLWGIGVILVGGYVGSALKSKVLLNIAAALFASLFFGFGLWLVAASVMASVLHVFGGANIPRVALGATLATGFAITTSALRIMMAKPLNPTDVSE